MDLNRVGQSQKRSFAIPQFDVKAARALKVGLIVTCAICGDGLFRDQGVPL
jgi:hypothetical protein